MKYNLGCGKHKRNDFVNVDINSDVHPDIVADVRIIPWKWASENKADLIFTDNLFEHIREEPLMKVFQECHRVLKPDGLLQIIVPLTTLDNLMAVFSDPMHVNHNFTEQTYDYYDYRSLRWKNYGRVYGIPKFERVSQRRQNRFLIVELKAIKEGRTTKPAPKGNGKMKIGAILPHLGIYGGVRHFLEIGNIFIGRGMDYTIFSNQGQECDWFKCNFPIKNWDKIEADYIMIGDPPSFKVLPKVKGKIFVYAFAGGHFLKGYQTVYGKYPFILNNRVFSKYFPDSHLIEGGVNTEWFKPKKRKVLFYDDPRPCKGSTYIKEQLSGLDNIELVGLKELNNTEIAKAYRKGDYFVSWESREGWSNPSAEAIASGLTVVTNGVNCEPFSDIVITVENLREFFADPMKEFSWERVVDKLLEVFKEEE